MISSNKLPEIAFKVKFDQYPSVEIPFETSLRFKIFKSNEWEDKYTLESIWHEEESNQTNIEQLRDLH